MKIVIIEDEPLTAKDLADTLKSYDAEIDIVSILSSVWQSVTYLNNHPKPDLIFCDIQLGDGLSFEIFPKISSTAPVIFCTAYDEYALTAFKHNGIEYVLKPFTKQSIFKALDKFLQLKDELSSARKLSQGLSDLYQKEKPAASLLVYFREKILPIKFDDIALFYIENEATKLLTFSHQQFPVGKSLEELEQVAGDTFYRANRKVLVNRKAIKEATQYFNRKLLLNFTIPFNTLEPVTISKVKVNGFLRWLAGSA